MPPFLHPRVVEVTERIRERSWAERDDYLARMAAAARQGPESHPSVLHKSGAWFRQCADADKAAIRQLRWPNLAIINSYNDMLSAHQPLERYPVILRAAAREAGATAQVAGGVPAMCDGITQGMPGMELSLFSRDVIAMATGVVAGAWHVRCDAVPGGVRQDRAGTADRRTGVRASADHFRARRPHALGRAPTRTRRASASCSPKARSSVRRCWSPKPAAITPRAPAPSTARPTATRC